MLVVKLKISRCHCDSFPGFYKPLNFAKYLYVVPVLEIGFADTRDKWSERSEKAMRALMAEIRAEKPCALFVDDADGRIT